MQVTHRGVWALAEACPHLAHVNIGAGALQRCAQGKGRPSPRAGGLAWRACRPTVGRPLLARLSSRPVLRQCFLVLAV